MKQSLHLRLESYAREYWSEVAGSYFNSQKVPAEYVGCELYFHAYTHDEYAFEEFRIQP